MVRWSSGLRAVGLGFGALLAAWPLGAQGAEAIPVVPEPVRVSYQAAAGCPDEAAFRGVLLEKLSGATPLALDELARQLTVTIVADAGEFEARVELIDRAGTSVSRSVRADGCEQAVRAIALITALAARAQAEEGAGAPGSEPGPLEKPAAPTAGEPTPSVVVAAPLPAPPSPPNARAVPDRPRAFGFEVLATADVVGGVGPSLAPGVGLRGQLNWVGGRSALGVPALVLSANARDTFELETAVADARFQQLTARLELCPLAPEPAVRLRLALCAGFELGEHGGRAYADATRVARSERVSRLWMAGTLALRARTRAGPISLELGPELRLPFVRTEFALRNREARVYRVPAVAAGAGIGVGVAW